MNRKFEVIVVGGGHAGTEAALASARMGVNTLLITHKIDTLGEMSCNPAIGGIGKGHLVKEIDALGGAMALAADKAGIHFRTLNSSKGPAVRATRAQADRMLYKSAIRQILETTPNLTLFQQAVEDILLEQNRVIGVKLQMGLIVYANAVVLTAGTFLAGKIHIGLNQYEAGRAGDPPAKVLAHQLRELPLGVSRLKTGTPPRIDGRTVNFSVMEEQPGETPTPVFSFMGDTNLHPHQVSCHITHTNEKTHELIRNSLHESPLYTGVIEGLGPRYCPSIEDKIIRFHEKNSHQIFVEPEGLNTYELYPNGISTSLPFHTQLQLVHSIRGFENAHITRPGYAIEYDFFDPRGLMPTLQTKAVAHLFFAGQINGTTGYEEAAAQGLMAGINAALCVLGRDPFILERSEAYIGVLIDDLITRGAKEPYRMFTSRAEYRLLLREDNADYRLTPRAHVLGLISEARYIAFSKKYDSIKTETERLKKYFIQSDTALAHTLSRELTSPLTREISVHQLLLRPEISLAKLKAFPELDLNSLDDKVIEQIEISAKYAGYIKRQEEEIARFARYEQLKIPQALNYANIKGLSHEVIQKLNQAKPMTLGIASRVEGVTSAAISLLLVYLKKYQHES